MTLTAALPGSPAAAVTAAPVAVAAAPVAVAAAPAAVAAAPPASVAAASKPAGPATATASTVPLPSRRATAPTATASAGIRTPRGTAPPAGLPRPARRAPLAPDGLAAPSALPSLTVNSDGDGGDADSADGVCDVDTDTPGRQCTLRAAIQNVNLGLGGDIGFASALTIAVGAPLPAVTQPVVIDGSTVAGYPTTRVTVDGRALTEPAHGLQVTGASTVRGLLITGFNGLVNRSAGAYDPASGVWIHYGQGAVVDSMLLVRNGSGITVWDSSGGLIGGTSAARNTVLGSGYAGITVTGASTDVVVSGNDIGISRDTGTNGNSGRGIWVCQGVFGGVSGVPVGTRLADDVVVGMSAGGDTQGHGVVIDHARSTSVVSSWIGVLPPEMPGTGPSNAGDGIAVFASTDTVIGGDNPTVGNVISNNKQSGVRVNGAQSTGTRIAWNHIGTSANGRTAIPNQWGVTLINEANTSGGPRGTEITGNWISGNTRDGIYVAEATGTTIKGNNIGVDQLAAAPLGNGEDGVVVFSSTDTTIGSTDPGYGNEIGGNGLAGIAAYGTASAPTRRLTVIGNGIGASTDSNAHWGNSWGVALLDGTTDSAVGLRGSQYLTPGTTRCPACNLIAYNTNAGVQVQDDPATPETARMVSIRGNQTYANGGLGIDLVKGTAGDNVDAITTNDLRARDGSAAVDADAGPNDLLNAPTAVLTIHRPPAQRATGEYAISGFIDRAAEGAFMVDLYGMAADDPHFGKGPGSYGQGRVWLGSQRVFTGSSFNFVVPDDLVGSAAMVGATVTQLEAPTGDTPAQTSELSAVCVPLPGGGPDSDGDALCDEWEAPGGGVDIDRDGNSDLDLYALGARVGVRDVFVEVDRVEPVTRKSANGLLKVIDSFRKAPTPIALHLNTHPQPGTSLPVSYDPLFDDVVPASIEGKSLAVLDGTGFELVRNGATPKSPCDGYFGTAQDRAAPDCAQRLRARAAVYRYAVFADRLYDATLGLGQMGGGNFAVGAFHSSSDWNALVFSGRLDCAGNVAECEGLVDGFTFMHELGHNLGLSHGGIDEENFKPNYLSVMNYAFTNANIVPDRPLDFSRTRLPNLVETELSETNGLGVSARPPGWKATVRMTKLDDGTCIALPVDELSPVNWNDSRDATGHDTIDPGTVQFNINGNSSLTTSTCADAPTGPMTPLTGYDDWSNLDYDLRYEEGDYAAFLKGLTNPPSETGELPTRDGDYVDYDRDGVVNSRDVCPATADPAQADADHDGLGDACVGQVNGRNLKLTAAGSSSAPVGSTVQVPVTLDNTYPNTATGITVAVRIPAGLSFLASWTSAGTVTQTVTNGVVTGLTWRPGSVPRRTQRVLNLSLTVTGPDPARLEAEVTAASQPDPDSTPNNHNPFENDQSTTVVTGTPVSGTAPSVPGVAAQTATSTKAFTLTVPFTDPDSTAHTATVSWGDGSPGSVATVNEAGHTVSATHTYGGIAAFTARVCVTDSGGLRGCAEVPVNVVANPTPGILSVNLGAAGPAPRVSVADVAQSVTFTDATGAATRVDAADGTFASGSFTAPAVFTVAGRDGRAVPYRMGGTGGPAGLVVVACSTVDGLDTPERQFIAAVNEYRLSLGLTPLGVSRTATVAAFRQATDTATTGVLAHSGSDGSNPGTRMRDAGYPAGAMVGENLLTGSSTMTAAQAFEWWKASPGHDANMRDVRWRTMGIARVRAANGATWWATTFGSVHDCAPNPVAGAAPAFTLSATATTAGQNLTFTNRSRTTTGKFAPGSLNPVNGSAAVTVPANGSTTFSYPTGGTKLPAFSVAQVRARAAVSVIDAASLVIEGPASVTSGGAATLVARLTNARSGAAVAGVAVAFTLGTQTATATTGADGRASAPLTVAQPAGTLTLTAASPATGAVGAGSASAQVTVLPATVAVTVTYTGPRWLVTGRTSRLKAVVTDASSKAPVVGQAVRFTLAGTSVDAVTGAGGVAVADVNPGATGAATLVLAALSASGEVTGGGSVPVTRVAPATASVFAGAGAGPFDLTITHLDIAGFVAAGGVAWVIDRTSNSLLRVDMAARTAAVAMTPAQLGQLPGEVASVSPPNSGIAFDPAGRIVLSNPGTHRILRYDPVARTVTTIAGTGTAGNSGNGGPATAAQLNGPTGLAVAADGTITFADTGNRVIRRIDPAGTIGVVLGAGAAGAAGAVTLSYPVDVALPAGYAFAALSNSPTSISTQVYLVGADGTVVSPAVDGPVRDLATHPDGGLLIVRAKDISRVTTTGVTALVTTNPTTGLFAQPTPWGRVTRLPGDGGPPGAGLYAFNIAGFDDTGDLLVSQWWRTTMLRRIRGLGTTGAVVSTVAGSPYAGFSGVEPGPANGVLLGEPSGVAIGPDGRTYLADPRAYRVYAIDPDGTVHFEAGDPVGQQAVCDNTRGLLAKSSVYLCVPQGMATAPDGSVTILDSGHGQVLGDQPASGGLSLVAGAYPSASTAEGVAATSANLQGAAGLTYDPSGRVVVVDTWRHRIRRITTTRTVETFVGTGTAGFAGDGGPATAAQLSSPNDAAYDADGNLYLADTGNHRIRRVDAATGVITTIAGTGTAGFTGDGGAGTAAALNQPTGVLVVGHDLLIADHSNHRIRSLDLTTGTITTIAGNGTTTTAGGSGPAAAATVPWPTRIATDGGGTVLVTTQRGGYANYDPWVSRPGTGAVLRVSLPAGH